MIRRLARVNLTALFAGILRLNRAKGKIKPITAILIGFLALYIIGAGMFTIGTMFHRLCSMAFNLGLGWFFFAIEGLLVFALCFISSIFMVQAQLFSARDNELLLSMPIKPSAIISGRIVSLLVMEYFFEAIIVVPVFAVLVMTGNISQISSVGIAFFFAAALLLPLVALAAGCLVGWLIMLATSRMRNKNILTLLLSLGFLVAYFMLYTRVMDNIGFFITQGAAIAEAVRKAVFPVYHLGAAIADGSVISFLIFAAFAILPFIIMCELLSASFVKLATGGHKVKKVKYKEKALRESGARSALLKRQLLHFWSQPMYILNTALGVVATIAAAVVLIVKADIILDLFDPDTGVLANFIDQGVAGAVALTAFAALNTISAPSVSLEGKQLWIVKSLPVRAREVLMSKVWLHFMVGSIPALMAGVICIVTFPMNLVQMALTIVMPAAATMMFALFGVVLNLTFPRFDWVNPIQPIKQSLSVTFSLLGSVAFVVALALAYVFLLSGTIAPEIYLLACTAVFAVASAMFYTYVTGAGGKKFETF